MDQVPDTTTLAPLGIRRRLFTADEYDRMVEAGVLRPDERVELIDGEILHMSPIGGPHITALMRLVQLLVPPVAGHAGVSVQGSVRLHDGSEPQPDLALLRPQADPDDESIPRAEEVLLLIEVADTNLAFDRRIKRPLCARSGIPEYWILDLQARTVEVCRVPGAEDYTSVETKRPGDVIGIAALPGMVAVPVAGIVGRRPA